MRIRAGDILRVTRRASVQFGEPFYFRLSRVLPWSTYDGWVWLEGYQLNYAGWAVEHRKIFVQTKGLLRMDSLTVKQLAELLAQEAKAQERRASSRS